MTILDDIKVYVTIIRYAVRSQLQYKASYISGVITGFMMAILKFIGIYTLIESFETIKGWSIGEVALLYAISSISYGISDMFTAGFSRFDRYIQFGDFDSVLVRPVPPLLQISGQGFNFKSLGRIAQGILVLIYAINNVGLEISPLNLLFMLLTIVSSSLIFMSLNLLGASTTFWTVQRTRLINLLSSGGRDISNYPIDAFGKTLAAIVTFIIPIAFVSYVPSIYLLGKEYPLSVWLLFFISVFVSLLFGGLVSLFWRFSLGHYQSTGT